MGETTIDCAVCGGAARRVTETRPISMQGQTVSAPDDFYRCDSCGEEFYKPGMMDATLRAGADAARAAGGLLTPAEVKAIRTGLGLTQPEFERLLGVGKNTAVRWERGTVSPGAAADALLRLVARDPGNARFLAERHGVALA